MLVVCSASLSFLTFEQSVASHLEEKLSLFNIMRVNRSTSIVPGTDARNGTIRRLHTKARYRHNGELFYYCMHNAQSDRVFRQRKQSTRTGNQRSSGTEKCSTRRTFTNDVSFDLFLDHLYIVMYVRDRSHSGSIVELNPLIGTKTVVNSGAPNSLYNYFVDEELLIANDERSTI